MKKFGWVLALLCGVVLYGCERNYEEITIISTPQDETPNLTYTLWQGTVTTADKETLPVSIAFSAESGSYYLDGEPYDFNFEVFGETVEQCAVRISTKPSVDSGADMLVDFWWVMEWSDDTLVLETNPFNETTHMVMRLGRVR